ncbi:MAG: 4'-phosphopantetheinyl transferase superfamily protein [Clostridia bacterium]|nr:4'-phosphopantetheinyl transferase superfamily protein [Clostridia bacterium]
MEWFRRKTESLTPTEYDRCLALMEPSRREKTLKKASVLGEWMVKTALAERLQLPLEAITLLRTPKGKPYAELPLHFSISHSGDWVAVAVDEQPIGIDIEVLRPIDLRITRKVCTEKDLLHLEKGDPQLRFFEIWTAKEAYFKRLGTGITDLKGISYTDLKVQHFYEENCIITINRP